MMTTLNIFIAIAVIVCITWVLRALQKVQHLMTAENQQVLEDFNTARQRWLGARLVGLKRTRIFRQTTLGNMGIVAAALINRL